MEYVLEIKGLSKKYKNFTALKNVNLHLEKGSIYGLIGKNGAGKTTLIRIICGLQVPSEGTYTLYGYENTIQNIEKARKRMSAIIESPSLYQNLSAKDNLLLQYQVVGLPSKEGIEDLLHLVGLENVGKKKVKNFSLGMKQRLGIAVALASHPDFLILDEPINGLDPEGIIEIRELILKLNKQKGITILISSHYLDEMQKIATHYGFLNEGRIVKEVSAETLNTSFQKRLEIKVNSLKVAVSYLEENQFSYEVAENNKIHIYGDNNISKLILELAKKNCTVEEIKEVKESLENYYMNLIGGKKND